MSIKFLNRINLSFKKILIIFIAVIFIVSFLKFFSKFNPNVVAPSVIPPVIPPIIHYMFLKGEKGMILKTYLPYIQNCLEVNKDVKFILWTKENMNLLLEKVATKIMKMHMQEDNRRLIHRADIFRYIVLYYFGGIYMDLDTIYFKPIYSRIKNDSFVLTIEPRVHTRIHLGIDTLIANNFIATKPKHPFMKYLLDNLNKNPSPSDDVLSTTGPIYFEKLFHRFNKKHFNLPFRILNTSEYFPELNIQLHRDKCKDKKKIPACDELESYNVWLLTKGLKEAVLGHASLNIGWEDGDGPTFNASQKFPDIKFWP